MSLINFQNIIFKILSQKLKPISNRSKKKWEIGIETILSKWT